MQRCLVRADATCGIDLAASMGWYWITRATTEGMRWLDEFLALGGGDPSARAWGWFLHGFLALLKADPAAARPALQTAVAAARQTGQRDVLWSALAMGSIAEMMAGEPASARHMLDEAQVTAAGQADPAGPISVLQARALNAFMEADLDTVRSAASEGILLAREAGDLYSLEMMLLNLGSAALLAGDLGESKPLLAESLRIANQMDDRVARFYLLDGFGCHAALSGQPRLAAQLLGAADTVRTEAGANAMPFLASLVTQARESAATALGATRFTAEFEAGRRLDWDAALALALGKPAQAPLVASGQAGAGLLGKREAEVARLVADGLTNKEIGARLFISERTVDSHVRSILNKLGFNSRAQIAAWIASPDN